MKEAFVSRGIGAGHLVLTAPASGSGLKHCPSPRTCCREAMVRRYQNSIVQDYDSVVGHVVAPLKGLLHQSIADFEHHFDQLLQISLNKTNHLFQVNVIHRKRGCGGSVGVYMGAGENGKRGFIGLCHVT